MRTLFCASFVAAALAAANPVEAQIADGAAPFAPSAYDGGHTQPAYPATGKPAYPITGAYLQPQAADEFLWFRGEYLLWGIKDGDIPPLVTTGSAADAEPAALGQPGTRVLFGDELDYGSFNGARFTIGGWFEEHNTLGAEVSFFLLDRQTEALSASSPGSPVLGRPFLNVITGTQSAALLALPGVSSGRVNISSSSRLCGFEINGLCNPWYQPVRGPRLDLLYGFRYVDLEEDLAIGTAAVLVTDTSFPEGTEFAAFDNFDTRNRFYGGQAGVQWQTRRGPLSFRLLGKLALGATHQNVRIAGVSVRSVPGTNQVVIPGGGLAQRTNIGEYSRDRFSVIPEVGAHVGYEILEGLSVHAGYTFLYWTNVARSGDQIDPALNLIPDAGGPQRPAFTSRDSDFWAHGLNIGAELRF